LDGLLFSISRFFFISLTFSLISVSLGQATNSCKLKGKVFDTNTGKPIELVNVYLSGTTFGASTSRAGIYLMENILPGTYQLVFQHIGYEIKVKNIQIEKQGGHRSFNKYTLKIFLAYRRYR
jgi:hypothetical protein